MDIGSGAFSYDNGTRWPTSVLVCLVCDTGEGAAEQPGLQILVSSGFPLSGLEGFVKNSMGDGPDRDNARDARRGHTAFDGIMPAHQTGVAAPANSNGWGPRPVTGPCCEFVSLFRGATANHLGRVSSSRNQLHRATYGCRDVQCWLLPKSSLPFTPYM